MHSFSLAFRSCFPARLSVDAAYVGSRTLRSPTSRGFNELPADRLALGDVTRGGNPNYLNERLPNPYENLLPGSSINSGHRAAAATAAAVSGIHELQPQDIPNGKVWYNSLQVAVNKRYSQGLTFTAAYTSFEEHPGVELPERSGCAAARSLVPWDRPHRLVLAPIYELPFGPGKRFLAKAGRLRPRGRRLAIDDEHYLARRQSDDRAGQRVPTANPSCTIPAGTGCSIPASWMPTG